jgi:hypothetical protein
VSEVNKLAVRLIAIFGAFPLIDGFLLMQAWNSVAAESFGAHPITFIQGWWVAMVFVNLSYSAVKVYTLVRGIG